MTELMRKTGNIAGWIALGLTISLPIVAAWVAAMNRLTAVEVSIQQLDRNITQQLDRIRIVTESHVTLASHPVAGEQIRQLQRDTSQFDARLSMIETQMLKPKP